MPIRMAKYARPAEMESKRVFIATQLNWINWPSWTAYNQVSRVFVYDVTTYKLSWLLFTLSSWVQLSWVQLSWVELCRYKRALRLLSWGHCLDLADFMSDVAVVRYSPGRKGSTSNSQHDNCYPDREGHTCHTVTPVCGRSVARSILQKDTVQYCPWNWWPTRHRSFLHPHAAPVTPVSCYGNDSQQRSIGLVLANWCM